MRKKMAVMGLIYGLMIVGMCLRPCSVPASDCRHDPIVRDWILERNQAEQHLLSRWAKGRPTDELASDAGIIVSNELFIAGKCRNESFLKHNLHFLGIGNENLRVETLPCTILERLLGREFFSPHGNFPGKEGVK